MQGSLQPDLTLVLDVDPARGLTRARQRGSLDRFEKQQLAFFTAVRQVYLDRAQRYPQRFQVIDAGAELAAVQAAVVAAVSRFLA